MMIILAILGYLLIGFIYISVLSYKGELYELYGPIDYLTCVLFWPIHTIVLIEELLKTYCKWLENKGKKK